MKSLNYYQLSLLASSLISTLKGNHIPNVIVVNKSDIILNFSFYRKEKMLISLSHESPFISLINNEISIPSILNSLCEELRKNIKDTVIDDIYTLNSDRILEIKLLKTDDFFAKHELFLVLELIPRHPNLLILNSDRKIIFATHYTSIDSERLLLKGMLYNLPNKNSNYEADKSFNELEYKSDANKYLPSSLEKRNKEKYHTLYEAINRKIAISIKKESVLHNEINDAKKKLVYQEYGTMLLTLKDDEEELGKYIKENNIPYDQTKSLIDNVNVLFKKYKKAKETIKQDQSQIEENKLYLEDLKSDLSSLDSQDESIFMILTKKYLKTTISNQEINKISPYFVVIDGTKIGFGRNASQNTLLTFKKAKASHYFFHLENYHGSHVVILKDNPTDTDKQNAAELCLALANLEAANVQMAEIKNIKKGSVQGQVLLQKYTVIKINNVKPKIKNALQKAKRITF